MNVDNEIKSLQNQLIEFNEKNEVIMKNMHDNDIQEQNSDIKTNETINVFEQITLNSQSDDVIVKSNSDEDNVVIQTSNVTDVIFDDFVNLIAFDD